MRTHQEQQSPASRTLPSEPRASRQAPLEELIARHYSMPVLQEMEDNRNDSWQKGYVFSCGIYKKVGQWVVDLQLARSKEEADELYFAVKCKVNDLEPFTSVVKGLGINGFLRLLSIFPVPDMEQAALALGGLYEYKHLFELLPKLKQITKYDICYPQLVLLVTELLSLNPESQIIINFTELVLCGWIWERIVELARVYVATSSSSSYTLRCWLGVAEKLPNQVDTVQAFTSLQIKSQSGKLKAWNAKRLIALASGFAAQTEYEMEEWLDLARDKLDSDADVKAVTYMWEKEKLLVLLDKGKKMGLGQSDIIALLLSVKGQMVEKASTFMSLLPWSDLSNFVYLLDVHRPDYVINDWCTLVRNTRRKEILIEVVSLEKWELKELSTVITAWDGMGWTVEDCLALMKLFPNKGNKVIPFLNMSTWEFPHLLKLASLLLKREESDLAEWCSRLKDATSHERILELVPCLELTPDSLTAVAIALNNTDRSADDYAKLAKVKVNSVIPFLKIKGWDIDSLVGLASLFANSPDCDSVLRGCSLATVTRDLTLIKSFSQVTGWDIESLKSVLEHVKNPDDVELQGLLMVLSQEVYKNQVDILKKLLDTAVKTARSLAGLSALLVKFAVHENVPALIRTTSFFNLVIKLQGVPGWGFADDIQDLLLALYGKIDKDKFITLLNIIIDRSIPFSRVQSFKGIAGTTLVNAIKELHYFDGYEGVPSLTNPFGGDLIYTLTKGEITIIVRNGMLGHVMKGHVYKYFEFTKQNCERNSLITFLPLEGKDILDLITPILGSNEVLSLASSIVAKKMKYQEISVDNYLIGLANEDGTVVVSKFFPSGGQRHGIASDTLITIGMLLGKM